MYVSMYSYSNTKATLYWKFCKIAKYLKSYSIKLKHSVMFIIYFIVVSISYMPFTFSDCSSFFQRACFQESETLIAQ